MKIDEDLRKTYIVSEVGSIIQLTIFQEEKKREDNVRRVKLIDEDVLRILEINHGKEYTALVDTSAISKISYVSKNARRVYAQIAGYKQIKKIAVVGHLGYIGAIVNIVILLSGHREKLGYFYDSKDALKWLA